MSEPMLTNQELFRKLPAMLNNATRPSIAIRHKCDSTILFNAVEYGIDRSGQIFVELEDLNVPREGQTMRDFICRR